MDNLVIGIVAVGIVSGSLAAVSIEKKKKMN